MEEAFLKRNLVVLGSENSLKQSEFNAAWIGSGDKEIETVFAVLNVQNIDVLKKYE